MNAIYTVLKEGSTGVEVTKLQEDLKKLNFYLSTIDGIFGAKTKEAVIKFQKSQQLIADGIVGEKTWSKLNAVLNNSRFDFLSIDVQEFVSSKHIKATNPKAVAAQLFSDVQEEQEGRFSEEISITYPREFVGAETAVILYTILGVADDSVNSIRDRIELKRNQNKWEIIWVGRQFKCQSGRGHQDWSGVLCS